MTSKGKYEIIRELKQFTEMDKLLLEQAKLNELAEANRLKRMELQHFQIRHFNSNLTEEDFEDKAGYVEGWKDQE